MFEKKKIAFISMFVIGIVLFFAFTMWRCTYVPITSDFSNLVLESADILKGNFFRNDWNLTGISFLTTDLPYFVIGVLIFGVSNKAYLLAFALMQMALILVSLLLVKDVFKKHYILNTLFFVAFAMMPCIFTLELLRAHTGVFVMGFVLLYLFISYKNKKHDNKLIVSAYIFILSLAIMGDPIVLVMVIAPICLWCIIAWIHEQITLKELSRILLINFSGVILGGIFDKLYFLIGSANKNDFMSSKAFVTLDELHGKFIIYLRSLIFMSDAPFEGQVLVQLKSLFCVLNVIAIIIFFIIIIYNIFCLFAGKKHDIITSVLGMGFLFMSMLFVMTSISVDLNSSRYYGYLLSVIAIVFVRNISNMVADNKRLYAVIIIAVSIIGIGRLVALKNDIKPGVIEQEQLETVLENNGLNNGYSNFWNASSITVLSSEKVKVRAVSGGNSDFAMFNWFCKNNWYTEKANFIITSDDDIYGVTPQNAENIFGTPSKKIVCGKYNILVYSHDISQKISKLSDQTN